MLFKDICTAGHCPGTHDGRPGLPVRFLRDENGSATISFLIWVPAFMFLLTFFTDLSLYFLSRTSMADVTRETARQVAIRGLAAADVPGYMEERFQLGGRQFWVDVDVADNQVTVDLDVVVGDATLFGIIELLTGNIMSVRAVVQLEPIPENIGTGAGTS